MSGVVLYDTTLRDGAQAEDVSFSLEDKLAITRKLDALGIHYIEGGWPGSNPKDLHYFDEVRALPLTTARIAAFGATRRPGVAAAEDANLQALIAARTPVVTIVGKAWDFHVREDLRIPLAENVEVIRDSLAFLKARVPEVLFDAEHFFDGMKGHRDYALAVIRAAAEAGADWIVLCDTNGGSLPHEVAEIVAEAARTVTTPLGIHAHNDSETAVANSLAAVQAGVRQVQGTINGFGERCGNANLCSIIPNLMLKMGIACVTAEQLRFLRSVARFVNELANLHPNERQPYVGASAFAHKGGLHVSAVQKNRRTYEHIEPELVGNQQRILVSELSGRSNILLKAKALGIPLNSKNPVVQKILTDLKMLENEGYQFEGAEASFDLLMKRALGQTPTFFELVGYRVISEKREMDEPGVSEATIMVKVGGAVEHTAATGTGPVHALDNALRKALEKFYPELKSVHLIDYKVRVLSTRAGTAARVRVLIESGDESTTWGTVGVSENILEASWQALTDSIVYKLLMSEATPG